MSMVQDFARIRARKYGLRVFFSETTGTAELRPFEGWEFVALPDGRVTDAVPLDPVPAMQSSSFLLEAFA